MDLEQWLRGERDCAPNLDLHQCKVGRWLGCEAKTRFELRPNFGHLVNLHLDLHRMGQSAASLRGKGDSEAALALRPEVWRLLDMVLTEIKVLLEEVGN